MRRHSLIELFKCTRECYYKQFVDPIYLLFAHVTIIEWNHAFVHVGLKLYRSKYGVVSRNAFSFRWEG